MNDLIIQYPEKHIENNMHYSSSLLYELEKKANGNVDGKVILGEKNAYSKKSWRDSSLQRRKGTYHSKYSMAKITEGSRKKTVTEVIPLNIALNPMERHTDFW